MKTYNMENTAQDASRAIYKTPSFQGVYFLDIKRRLS